MLNFFFYYLPLPSVAAFLAVLFNQMLVAALLPVGLYVSALALSGPAVAGRLRTTFHWLFAGIVLFNAALLSTSTIRYIAYSNAALEQTGVSGMLFAVSICVPLALLVVALVRADAARRLRLRWILFSLVLFIGPIAWNNLAQFSEAFTTRGVVRQVAWWTALLSGLAGLLYAVLRKRVVAMSFAINRALVYGLVVALVIGVFGVLTAVVENTAIGTDAGLALTVGVSLGIGLVLEALRDRINVGVERLFFRQRFEAETALRRFARECAYIENAERLLDEAQAEIGKYVRPDGSAFYTGADGRFVRVRQRGPTDWPAQVDSDDRAFVSMRADREPVDLRQTTSALGREGIAFPMAVRGKVIGALVFGSRTEEYTPDERRLVAELAQQVGSALHALRAREHEALVKALAEEEIDLAMARQRARAVRATGLSG